MRKMQGIEGLNIKRARKKEKKAGKGTKGGSHRGMEDRLQALKPA